MGGDAEEPVRIEERQLEEERILDLLQPALSAHLFGALGEFPAVAERIGLHQIEGAELAQHLDHLILRGRIGAEDLHDFLPDAGHGAFAVHAHQDGIDRGGEPVAGRRKAVARHIPDLAADHVRSTATPGFIFGRSPSTRCHRAL